MWGASSSIKIFDTTLRDGEQMPGVVFSPEEKIELAIKSSEFGCDVIKTMPSVSDSEAALVKRISNLGLKAEIGSACMLKKEHIKKTVESGVDRIMLFTPVSDLHLEHKLKITREENLQRALEMIDFAKDYGVKIDFATEDATRSDRNYLLDFSERISRYIEYFYPADTLGCLTPFQTRELFRKLCKKCRCKLAAHSHNDFGMATANTLAAIEGGASGFTGTFIGIGERAGNAPIEEVCLALRYLYQVELKLDFKKIKEICDLVRKYSGVELQRHKPLVGENAFAHESGIHIDGMMKNPRMYENFDPRTIGPKTKFLFGKHRGSSAIRYMLGGSKKSDREIRVMLSRIKKFSQENKKCLSETEMHDYLKNGFWGDSLEI